MYTLAEIELIEKKKELEKLLVMQEDFQLRRLYQGYGTGVRGFNLIDIEILNDDIGKTSSNI